MYPTYVPYVLLCFGHGYNSVTIFNAIYLFLRHSTAWRICRRLNLATGGSRDDQDRPDRRPRVRPGVEPGEGSRRRGRVGDQGETYGNEATGPWPKIKLTESAVWKTASRGGVE